MDINIKEIRESFREYMAENFPEFEYKGNGMNVGVWEMPDTVHLVRPIDDSISPARFRIFVFLPNRYGQCIKVEMFPHSVYEWECVFEGYIERKEDISRILITQLGLR